MTKAEEYEATIEQLQDKLDEIRSIVEEGKVKGVFPRLMDVLER